MTNCWNLKCTRELNRGFKKIIKVLYALIIGTHISGAVIDTREHCN
jgi:hypothetical protein